MGLDYYGILGVKKCCGIEDINKAFRRLAIKFFPHDMKMMCLVGEAYEVLFDPSIRALYDLLGEEELKSGLLARPYVYHGEPLKTFEKFYGTLNPFEIVMNNAQNPLPINNNLLAMGYKKKDESIFRDLPLTLEEVFFGGIKKLLIRRLEFADLNKQQLCPRERVLTVPIEPGILPGTKLVFKEQGDQGPVSIPADIVVVIQDRPHSKFERSHRNLIRKQKLSLKQSMKGVLITIRTLDKRILRVRIAPPIRPECVKTIEGEGLPLPGNVKDRGNLIIEFEVQSPTTLPGHVQAMIAEVIELAEAKAAAEAALQKTAEASTSEDKTENIFNQGQTETAQDKHKKGKDSKDDHAENIPCDL